MCCFCSTIYLLINSMFALWNALFRRENMFSGEHTFGAPSSTNYIFKNFHMKWTVFVSNYIEMYIEIILICILKSYLKFNDPFLIIWLRFLTYWWMKSKHSSTVLIIICWFMKWAVRNRFYIYTYIKHWLLTASIVRNVSTCRLENVVTLAEYWIC